MMDGEFKIERGFMTLDQVAIWSVINPKKSSKGDHIVYTVMGYDRQGKIEIERRFSEFEVLRQAFTERWPGLYVPPIPVKKALGNKNMEFITERCFLLNLFIKQAARCPYLLESEEFSIFIRPNYANMKREISLLPRLSPEDHLTRI